MSVQASKTMSAVWAKLEGHVVNGVFPLVQYVGSSDESAVFLTESAKHAPSTVALKLVRIAPALADSQLSRWRAAADLSHPHLIRIFEAGQCDVGEQHCLYVLMEYAEQHLAQLLEQRALAEDEAREMLVPTLSALTYLHERQLIQGQLKPSNILVVGDQLKLASDSVRAVGESAGGVSTVSAYDAPETRDGSWSTAGDVWALGVTMCEALTRLQPSGLHGRVGEAELPSDLQPPFREIVARCLRRDPRERPQVAELQAWVRGEPMTGATAASLEPPAISLPPSAMPQTATERTEPQSAAVAASGSPSATPSTVRLTIRAEILPEEDPETTVPQHSNRRALALVLGAVVVLALGWVGVRLLRTEAPPMPATSPAITESVRATPVAPQPTEAKPVEPEVSDEPDASPSPINEVIPDVPRSALQTIRGTVRVSIRVIVDKDGTVLAATPEDPGPSRYFERLATEASKKWTFAPADTEEQRLMLVRFNFTRAGATARANPLE